MNYDIEHITILHFYPGVWLINTIFFNSGQTRKTNLANYSPSYWIISIFNQIFSYYVRFKLRSNTVSAKSEDKQPYKFGRWNEDVMPTKVVSNSDAVIKSVKISAGMWLYAGNQCSLCYPQKTLTHNLSHFLTFDLIFTVTIECIAK